jgi:hypothetical protein
VLNIPQITDRVQDSRPTDVMVRNDVRRSWEKAETPFPGADHKSDEDIRVAVIAYTVGYQYIRKREK